MTKMMMLFSLIIVVGLLLTWVNDLLERTFERFRPQTLSHKLTAISLQSRQLVATPVQPNSAQSKVKAIAIPRSVAISKSVRAPGLVQHDYTTKIVKIDLAPRSRPGQDESGEKLGEHVTVLPKAA